MNSLRKGFTLLEIMVATLLLAMLVTILTMIFNQSSIAWTTGLAACTTLGDTRRDIAIASAQADNVVPDDNGAPVLVTSIWKGHDKTVVDRPISSASGMLSQEGFRDLPTSTSLDVSINANGDTVGRDSYIVGVTSYGPDGKANTFDDITTMPEEVVK